MFARLCTTIRWLGTAMFVAVLIVWGFAATLPMQTTLDLSPLHHATIHPFDLMAGRRGFALASFKSVGPDYSYCTESAMRNIAMRSRTGPGEAPPFKVLEFSGAFGVEVAHGCTYNGASAPERYASGWIVRSPWWPPLVLTLPFAARTTQLTIRRRRTRANPTACKSCGYDLRAGHDKCPECGGESHVKVGDSDSTNTPSAPAGQR